VAATKLALREYLVEDLIIEGALTAAVGRWKVVGHNRKEAQRALDARSAHSSKATSSSTR
jgi:hypothetical protein